MGNDGGSIPTRRELVKSAARAPTISELKATALESLSHAWAVCPLSSEPLDLENVVSDWRGRLYNYESVLKGLIPTGDTTENDTNGNDDPAAAEDESPTPHEMTFASTGIKSLRDVVKLKLKRYKPAGSKEKEIWACPVSLKELGPSTKAVYIVPCGHVFAEVAIREMVDERLCPECSEPFEKTNVIPIFPTEKAEIERLRQRIEGLREKGLTHSLKKEKGGGKKKKRKAGDVVENGDAQEDGGAEGKTEGHPPSKAAKLSKGSETKRASGINNPMTASLTARVLAEQEERNKQRKLAAARG